MRTKNIFRYFGGKFYMIKDILNFIKPLYYSKKIDYIIDVFGGSGTLLVNIPSSWRVYLVYNDLDELLYNVFIILQNDEKRKKLIEKIEWAFGCQEIYNEYKNEIFDENFYFEPPNLEVAFKWLYINTFSFSGMHESNYAVKRNKRDALINNLKQIKTSFFRRLNVLNLDYKDLIRRFNKNNVFLYLDPPYLEGGSEYRKGGWSIENFEKLNETLKSFKGYWLLNESSVEKISKIFGKPVLVKEYINCAGKSNTKRTEGFWCNFCSGVDNNTFLTNWL